MPVNGNLVDWIQAVANIVTALGIALVWWQVRADHKRSRTENACNLMREWTIRLDKSAAMAVHLVEKLDNQGCKDIFEFKEVRINKRWQSLVAGCLKEVYGDTLTFRDEGNMIVLEEKHSSHVRYLIENFLSLTESSLASWHYAVADAEIITKEFTPILKPYPDAFRLETYRGATDASKAYPAIEQFIRHLKESALDKSETRKSEIA